MFYIVLTAWYSCTRFRLVVGRLPVGSHSRSLDMVAIVSLNKPLYTLMAKYWLTQYQVRVWLKASNLSMLV